MWNFLKPAPHKDLLPEGKIDSSYKSLRWQVFIPYQLAYGASGNSSIQGYSMLRFEMVLKSYKRVSGKKWITE